MFHMQGRGKALISRNVIDGVSKDEVNSSLHFPPVPQLALNQTTGLGAFLLAAYQRVPGIGSKACTY